MLGTSAIAGTAAAQDVVSADGSETRTYSATATADDGSLIDVSVDAPSGASDTSGVWMQADGALPSSLLPGSGMFHCPPSLMPPSI